jgi:hypothetical protein
MCSSWLVVFSIVLFSAVASASDVACGSLLDSRSLTDLDLDGCRPAPLSPDEKSRVVSSLPTDGEVTRLTGAERAKLQAVQRVLRLHHRDGVYEVKVVDVRQAGTALYHRAVVLISHIALRLLNAEELQAVIAHEVGHEYIWAAYAAAESAEDSSRLRELELVCDAVAVLTLSRLGIKPDRLFSALETIGRYNKDRFGTALNEKSYPSLTVRKALINRMAGASTR